MTKQIYKLASLAACVLILVGLTFAGQTSTRANTGLSAKGSPFAPLTGPDTRVSNSGFSGDQKEYSIAINPNDSKYAVSASIHVNGGGEVIAVYHTSDGGQTWAASDTPFPDTKDPSVAYSLDGSVYVAGFEEAEPPVNHYMRSTDNGVTFGPAMEINLGDRMMLTVDNGATSPSQGTLYAVAFDFLDTPVLHVVFQKSTDEGATWSDPGFVGAAVPEGGYVDAPIIRVASDGTLYVSWQEYATSAACGGGNTITNMIARSTDGGDNWTENTIGSGPIVQGGACAGTEAGGGLFCINPAGDSFPSRSNAVIAIKPSDPNTVYAVYAGGDLESAYTCGTDTGFHSDTLFTRSTNGGATWSAITKINGDGQGKDQFMPWMDVAPNGTLWAGWQDRREDANNYMMRWYQAYSVNGGTTWTEAPVADSMSQPDTFIGDYHGLAAATGQVLGMWWDSRNNLSGDPYTEAHVLNAHVAWEGHPGSTSVRNEQPINFSIKLGTAPRTDYPAEITDGDGNFDLPDGVPPGTYTWRAKGSKFLARSGTVSLPAASTLDLGTLKGGDANNDNVVNATDFNIMRVTFGKAFGDPGYNAQGDFDDSNVVNAVDFSILRGNFGTGGAPPLASPGG